MSKSPKQIGLVGLGLIGSSIAHGIRRWRPELQVVGYDRDPAVRQQAAALGFCHSVVDTPAELGQGTDLLMLAVPVGSMANAFAEVAPALKPGAIVSDVGSVKQAVIDALQPLLPTGVHLVPGHPVAGTEQSGPEAGFAELFQNRWCILTPVPDCPDWANEAVNNLWQSLGSQVTTMDAPHHDLVLAITSHIPHLIAFTIVGTATGLAESTQREVIQFSAGGFRDFTRIAAGDPIMWRDIFLNNRDAVLEMLGRLTEDLTAMQRAIRFGDGQQMADVFARARAIRRSLVQANQHIPPQKPTSPPSAHGVG
ncbi:MAG: prephenate/arogenate dehydrogenase family protein [Alphaproteobacteria bacterium]|nr:prephenate/arogenate dehydrogenase family protein [Alphaproteobacteria bacterium]